MLLRLRAGTLHRLPLLQVGEQLKVMVAVLTVMVATNSRILAQFA